jgi:hypothetical protein
MRHCILGIIAALFSIFLVSPTSAQTPPAYLLFPYGHSITNSSNGTEWDNVLIIKTTTGGTWMCGAGYTTSSKNLQELLAISGIV